METDSGMKKVTTLTLLKSTGNTHVYQEEGHERHKQVFPTVYVQKHNFGAQDAPPPHQITIAMSWERP